MARIEDNRKDSESEDEAGVMTEGNSTFESLGLIEQLSSTCKELGFSKPTPIQAAALPPAFSGRDIIGLAQTGSGKTAAFALPLLQELYRDLGDKDFRLTTYGLVLAPTRELAFQIAETFTALGKGLGGVRVVTLVGGIDIMSQAIGLAKKPHVIVATPGRLLDHLENTKGFSLRGLKYLILDEADRLLDMDFGPILDKILKILPKERRTMLFSATMTSKVAKLQRASLTDPIKVEYYLFFPFKEKDSYLVYLCNEFAGHLIIIFTRTCADAQRLTLLLRNLEFPAVALHGQLSQSSRLSALTRFKASSSGRDKAGILVATDVASRGLDIPAVDLVLNYDVPLHSKDYIHRVGRTARAGRSGQSVVFVTQYDIEVLLRIEKVLGKKLTECPVDKDAVALLTERVDEAARLAIHELRERAAKEKEKAGGGGGGSRFKRVKRSRDVGEEDLHG